MKITVIAKLLYCIKKIVLNSLRHLLSMPLFIKLRWEKTQGRKLQKKNIYTTLIIIIPLIILFYISPISKKLATFVENKIFDVQKETEKYWTPSVPKPIHEVEYVFPEISSSFMLSLASGYYLGQEKTTIENVDLFSEYILLELERRNQTSELFELPTNFKIKETIPIQNFYTTERIEECDGQILDAYQDATKTHDPLSYHRIGITALDALNLLKKAENNDQDEYIYYAELAFYGFGNEYILDRPTDGARADWFYRIAQVYDYLGWIANDKDPPLQHEMYFISAGFLHLSFGSLSSLNFDANKCSTYRHDIWELDLIMLYRLGIYFDNSESFFNRLKEHRSIIYKLPLTTNEEKAIQDIINKVDEWEHIANSKFS